MGLCRAAWLLLGHLGNVLDLGGGREEVALAFVFVVVIWVIRVLLAAGGAPGVLRL